MAVCAGDRVAFPWQFRHGTSCDGKPTTIDLVTWRDHANVKIAERDAKGFRSFIDGMTEGRISEPSDSLQSLEIIVASIRDFGKGGYSVEVDARDDDGSKVKLSEKVNVTTEERASPS